MALLGDNNWGLHVQTRSRGEGIYLFPVVRTRKCLFWGHSCRARFPVQLCTVACVIVLGFVFKMVAVTFYNFCPRCRRSRRNFVSVVEYQGKIIIFGPVLARLICAFLLFYFFLCLFLLMGQEVSPCTLPVRFVLFNVQFVVDKKKGLDRVFFFNTNELSFP